MRKNNKKKNDGAWYRANKFLKQLRDPQAGSQDTQFLARLKTDPDLISAVNVIRGVCANLAGSTSQQFESVASGLGFGANATAQLANYLNTGFPRTVWMGELSNDVNVPVEPGAEYPAGYYGSEGEARFNDKGVTIYVPMNAPAWRQGAHQIREKMMAHMRIYRQMLDISNADSKRNPGGVADATDD